MSFTIVGLVDLVVGVVTCVVLFPLTYWLYARKGKEPVGRFAGLGLACIGAGWCLFGAAFMYQDSPQGTVLFVLAIGASIVGLILGGISVMKASRISERSRDR